ncbi:AraC family transcriptional regulator [Chryseobacterium culicis]|uniref:AraC family transcriptional regulator n=1 Tax=Chryseobacterium culicis TaxID=680127 RepID=A0A2S9CMR5_CHRCI|nr:AraC family transcriptional regulator [Chryseobacterium culicis]PRB81786.1 AraC family transcriptional regulator [Chryseobacterium culicis]PRB88441.1 AraC family transcriptional regulator [Chryseobacterium culicis]
MSEEKYFDPENYIIYNNNDDDLVCYYSDQHNICETRINYHCLIYIISGKLTLRSPEEDVSFESGQTVFIKRNHFLHKEKIPSSDSPFCCISLHFKPTVLRRLYNDFRPILSKLEDIIPINNNLYEIIPENFFTQTYFETLHSFVKQNFHPSRDIMLLKIKEILYYIIEVKQDLIPHFFDISDPWKIDLEKFVEENYTSDLSINELAHFTGRSISTLKKDFYKIFGETPSRWITKRRLEKARDLILNSDKKPNEVYGEVGFKNFSHFSKSFKNQFGETPSMIKPKL